MDSDTDIDVSGSDIEDMFKSSISEFRGGRNELKAKNDAIDQRMLCFTFADLHRIWL